MCTTEGGRRQHEDERRDSTVLQKERGRTADSRRVKGDGRRKKAGVRRMTGYWTEDEGILKKVEGRRCTETENGIMSKMGRRRKTEDGQTGGRHGAKTGY